MELSELLGKVDIVEYISQFVDLEQRGEEWWGLSCFKNEKTPSFSVRQTPAVWFDYSSGKGGNLFTFIKDYFKCSSREAIEKLSEYANVDEKITNNRKKLDATICCKKFTDIKYEKKQQIQTDFPEDCMLKYTRPEDKLYVWKREGISQESLDRFQVCYDDFTNRIVYPIRDASGKIVNIGGRTLDPDYKEKKLRKYTYFAQWGIMTVIYGLYENMEYIKQKNEIIIFEGCKSVLLADTWGIKNTSAILTSHLNPHQMKQLLQFGNVVFALDKDVDIKQDANIQKLKRYTNVFYVKDNDGVLNDKDSPVDKGYDNFIYLYNNRVKLK